MAESNLTDAQVLQALLQSDLWDMHKHMGWYSAPEKRFKEFGLAFARDIERALASPPVAVQEEGDAWQPIETAPKDGTDVLLSNGVVVAEGHWLHDEGGTTEFRDMDGRYIGQDDSDGFIGWIDWSGGMIPAPTVWQHKPAPPAAMKGDQP